jgi:2Fe-2S ferredoxin
MYTIQISFEEEGLMPISLTNVEGGQTLLEVAVNNNIPLQHQCGGVCSCTTCHVYVEKGMARIREMNRREEDYLGRVKGANMESRLACQSLLLEDRGEISIRIPDQRRYLKNT